MPTLVATAGTTWTIDTIGGRETRGAMEIRKFIVG